MKLNWLVVPTTDWCAEFKRDAAPPVRRKSTRTAFTSAVKLKFDPWSAAHGRLTAFEASTGKEKWRYDAPKPMLAGVTVTAGDLVFRGELTSDLLALDARTGKVLLRSAVDGPSAGGLVTYDARGVQNVAIVSGFVGVFNSFAPDIGGANTTVTIFRLRGK
jgi:glucose dehydrogenase